MPAAKFRTQGELLETDQEYVEKIDSKVADMFNFSALVLDEDYYSYLLPYMQKRSG